MRTTAAVSTGGPAAALYPYALALRRPLGTGRGRVTHRRGLLLSLRDGDGHCGWGDVAPLPGWGGPDLVATAAVLTDWLRTTPPADDLEALSARADATLREVPCAWAAVGGATADLAARRDGLSLAAALGATTSPPGAALAVPTAALLDGDTPEAVAAAAARAAAAGFGAFKIKVGNRPLAADVARVAALREAIPAGATLRLDANGSWGTDAAAGIEAVAPFEPEFVEEPCSGLDELRRLQAATSVPLAVDESLPPLADLERHLPLGVAVAVIKPSALGAPRSVLRAVAALHDGATQVVVGSFLESAVGVATAAHVAAAAAVATGDRLLAAGLDTSALLGTDVCEPLPVEGGALQLPAGPGLGLTPDPARLERPPAS